MDATEIGRKSVDWIHPAQDRDQCHAIVNTVMNPIIVRRVISWLAKQLLANQVELHTKEFVSFLRTGA
jgi:hypothetical protein